MTDDDPQPAPTVVSIANSPRLALTLLACLATVWLLQMMQSLLIPIVIGVLIAYALEPIVSMLARARVPHSVGAAIVLVGMVAVIGAGVYFLTDQALQIVAQIPEATQKIRERVRHQDKQGAIGQVQQAATALQKTAEAATTESKTPQDVRDEAKGPTKVQVVEPAFDAKSYLYWGGVGLVGAMGQLAVVLFLVYFFLVTGDLYKRKIVKIAGPHIWQKKLTIQILDDINGQIESFMRVQVLTSMLVGGATMLALWYFGMRQYIIWGLLAGVFNSIPYLGPVLVTGGLGVIAFLQFNDIPKTLTICGVAFLITSVEGYLLTPALMGRAARMNPVAVFVGLLFWSWIWGIWGAVLAVPMLMMMKAVCDHIDDLRPIGELLGE
jgi:predicted PurR-regulated permease PerM